MARTFALIAPVWRVLQQVSCSTKRFQMRPNGKKRTKTRVWGPMVWIQRISSEMVANAPKRKETLQNLSLRSNGVDRDCLLRQISTRLRGMNFCINCTSLARFAASFVQ